MFQEYTVGVFFERTIIRLEFFIVYIPVKCAVIAEQNNSLLLSFS